MLDLLLKVVFSQCCLLAFISQIYRINKFKATARASGFHCNGTEHSRAKKICWTIFPAHWSASLIETTQSFVSLWRCGSISSSKTNHWIQYLSWNQGNTWRLPINFIRYRSQAVTVEHSIIFIGNMATDCAFHYGVQMRHGKWRLKELFALPYLFVYPLFKCLNCFSVTNVKTFSGKDYSTLA